MLASRGITHRSANIWSVQRPGNQRLLVRCISMLASSPERFQCMLVLASIELERSKLVVSPRRLFPSAAPIRLLEMRPSDAR
jgi:hypothetical protein